MVERSFGVVQAAFVPLAMVEELPLFSRKIESEMLLTDNSQTQIDISYFDGQTFQS